ncbi:hypothetical protein EYR40_009343 [Pleurotus pulmonarius]|nr:hypothetical protein EYR38_009564 [Pleurotus pulmonarius]KAF4590746.1 hypothetical protein EYR40_009343 [Pleurotus pulmonarius]
MDANKNTAPYDEKSSAEIQQLESSSSSSADGDALPESGSPERLLAEKRLVRKLDTRLLPTIFIIFIMNYIDRNGVTTARLQGMQQDLRISGKLFNELAPILLRLHSYVDVQYATVIAILFVSYCPAQIPSNMAAFYPGAIYLLSRWYTKKELALRSAILYAGLLVSNAFGALIAAGILSSMEGKRGIRAWRWLRYRPADYPFPPPPDDVFAKGSITCTIGFISMWALPDYPHNTGWVSGFDKRLAQARLAEDAGEADKDTAEDSPLKGLVMALKDPKVSIFAIMTTSQLLGLSFVQFFPTLTATLGFSTTNTLLLAAYVLYLMILLVLDTDDCSKSSLDSCWHSLLS